MKQTLSTSSERTHFETLKNEVLKLGKPSWRPLLKYTAELHDRCIRPVRSPFIYDYEEIGLGYGGSPAFGHWDIVHEILDTLPTEPNHARRQLLNNLAGQQSDGLIPGCIYFPKDNEIPWWNHKAGHPPLWPVAVPRESSKAILIVIKSFRNPILIPIRIKQSR